MHTGRRSARLVETMGLMLDAVLVDAAAVLQGEGYRRRRDPLSPEGVPTADRRDLCTGFRDSFEKRSIETATEQSD